jgi:hypothetical protein
LERTSSFHDFFQIQEDAEGVEFMSIGLVRAMGVSLVILLVAGCGDPPPRALYTVNYYKTHENDRLAKLKECDSTPGVQNSPDCLNATQAQSSIH